MDSKDKKYSLTRVHKGQGTERGGDNESEKVSWLKILKKVIRRASIFYLSKP